eukprot:COSAG01_NODE_44679_length_416_cov_2.334385_1_plen_59_part_01
MVQMPADPAVEANESVMRCDQVCAGSSKGSASSANKISLGKYENSVCHVASTVAVKIDY